MQTKTRLKKYLATVSEKDRPFFDAALQKKICIRVLSEEFRIVEFISKNTRRLMTSDRPSFNTALALALAYNKQRTKIVLHHNRIAVPRGITATALTGAQKCIRKENLKFPLVVKPVDGSLGHGVTANIKNLTDLRHAVQNLKQAQSTLSYLRKGPFIVEEMAQGKLYRILVLDGHVIACALRTPAHVKGDGKHTIQQLVTKENKKRKVGKKITIDKEACDVLRKSYGYTLASIPKNCAIVSLRYNPLISTGGKSIDKTKSISRPFAHIAVRATRACGLTYAGIDLITNNIAQNTPAPYVIIEINSSPRHALNEKPLVNGPGVPVTKILLARFMRTR